LLSQRGKPARSRVIWTYRRGAVGYSQAKLGFPVHGEALVWITSAYRHPCEQGNDASFPLACVPLRLSCRPATAWFLTRTPGEGDAELARARLPPSSFWSAFEMFDSVLLAYAQRSTSSRGGQRPRCAAGPMQPVHAINALLSLGAVANRSGRRQRDAPHRQSRPASELVIDRLLPTRQTDPGLTGYSTERTRC